ncbi:MAG: histidine phosphatase family protein [Acidocella sp.]|nr:histidine phosphatase family protein [Acidocella sp.]
MNRPDRSLPRIGLVRHGATAWSLASRYQGRADPPLCPQGHAEAARLATHAAGLAVSLIVSSPLRRARETAACLAARCALPAPEVDDGLSELDYGSWEGKTQAEIKAVWPEQMREWKRNPTNFTFPGGESLDQAQRRVTASLARWQDAEAVQTILLVTHSGWIRLAWLSLTGQSLASFRSIKILTGSLIWLNDHRRGDAQTDSIGEVFSCAL